MALSQVQCLDNHHVNSRVSEGKPEFFYSEDQRLALEVLIANGRDAFTDHVREKGVRDFLSEPELERIARTAEAYRPGGEHHHKLENPGPGNLTPGSGEFGGDGEVSLQYWPDRSEGSVGELDLGWPDSISYRGVTRVTVHTQPPAEGQTHIKEVVRKSIASAQRVIAVVMDVFTDVDIFRDLLDASYKRKVPVYIIIDLASVPCFLSMCGRADMHSGHLKNLRVRSCGGVDFFTRTAQKVRGSLSQKFLLIDADRAISGSYSFTWSSSRLDRNLITVITGQAVETFDLEFCDLYLASRGVSLNKVPMVDEPVPDLVLYSAPAPVSAAVARKLVNPKYALVATGNYKSPTSSDQNSSSRNPNGLTVRKKRLRHVVEEQPLHPGLAHLEKAYLIPYLPTWPEPDPPSDVIGFINIRDEKRANQVHLQRSERFETSQAIRFSTPLLPPLLPPPKTEEPASGGDAEEAEDLLRNTSADVSAAVSPTSKQPKEKTHTAPNKDQTDATESSEPPRQPSAPPTRDARTPAAPPEVAADPKPTSDARPTPAAEPAAPPIPKRRTLQLVLDPTPSGQPGQPQVSLMKMDQLDSLEGFTGKGAPARGRIASKGEGRDSGSTGDGSQDSTKVMCDRAANEAPSSNSTASEEEFYECARSELSDRDPVVNGATTGSGRGHRHGDGVNVMARLSQSMLDLRQPNQSEEGTDLIRQSQQLRHQGHQSPHRHIGQLFQTSKSPARGPKVIIAKPGSFHRPNRPDVQVIGGHRYWQSQAMQRDHGQSRAETRSSRSPRRHSPGYRKTDSASAQPAGSLGVSFSKLSNLRARGHASQTTAFESNRADR